MASMSTPFAEAAELIDVLSDRGYEPAEDVPEFIRADLICSGLGSVRIIVDDEVTVHVFNRHMVVRWTCRFTSCVPLSAVVSLLADAEASAASLGAGR